MIIRADSGEERGTGHIQRMLPLAAEAKNSGYSPLLLTNCEIPSIRERYLEQFVPVETLESDPGSDSDCRETQELANETDSHWIVLDGYHFDEGYQKQLMRQHKILRVDDHAHLTNYECTVLLNQNLHANKNIYEGKLPDSTSLLLGTKYTMLREEFTRRSAKPPTIPETAKKILVTLGGSDPSNLTLEVAKLLDQTTNSENHEVRFIVGPENEDLSTQISGNSFNYDSTVYSDVKNISDHMNWADLAIVSAGSTVWELCYLGIPMVTLTFADNQRPVADALNKANAGVWLNDDDNDTARTKTQTLNKVISSSEIRDKLAKNAFELVDGEGPSRIVHELRMQELSLRPATSEDRSRLWRWANEKSVRKSAYDSTPISWREHKNWFNERLSTDDTYIFIAEELNGTPVGQIRFEPSQENHLVDVSVDSSFRGQSFGSAIIEKGTQKVINESDIDKPGAWVKEDNPASLSAFQRAGYTISKKKSFRGEESFLMIPGQL